MQSFHSTARQLCISWIAEAIEKFRKCKQEKESDM